VGLFFISSAEHIGGFLIFQNFFEIGVEIGRKKLAVHECGQNPTPNFDN
jgi:hypothetical protein